MASFAMLCVQTLLCCREQCAEIKFVHSKMLAKRSFSYKAATLLWVVSGYVSRGIYTCKSYFATVVLAFLFTENLTGTLLHP